MGSGCKFVLFSPATLFVVLPEFILVFLVIGFTNEPLINKILKYASNSCSDNN